MESSNYIDNIINPLVSPLEKAGIYYRIFARKKSISSIKKKLDTKYQEYLAKGKKMQDFIGVRIIFYFPEDVALFHKKLTALEGYDCRNESNTNQELLNLSTMLASLVENNADFAILKDKLPLDDKLFMPQRLNIVMRMSNLLSDALEYEIPSNLDDNYKKMIDSTYEVQLRTVLSEGWHEVEHDLRYKTIKEGWWSSCKQESRQLNSLYASLESCEKALSHLISEIAYHNYKMNEWDAMIRNHLKLRFKESKLSQEVITFLNSNERIGKYILSFDRQTFIETLWSFHTSFSLTTDFAFYLINRLLKEGKRSEEILKMEPVSIKNILDKNLMKDD